MDTSGSGRGAGRGCRAATLLLVAALLAPAILGCAGDTTKYPQVRGRDGVVAIEITGVAPEGGRFLSYRSGSGKPVDFLVYRESSGTPRAVLDACRTCFRWKKGYVLDGAEVVCLKCDMRFTLDGLSQGIGSCVPIALPSEQRGDSLVIPVAALEAGAAFF